MQQSRSVLEYGTVDADLVRDAAKEVAGFFDILIVCGFAFDAYIANEFRQLGNLTVLKANMNPDLSMRGDLLKKTGTANLFTVFGEPDIDVHQKETGRWWWRSRSGRVRSDYGADPIPYYGRYCLLVHRYRIRR